MKKKKISAPIVPLSDRIGRHGKIAQSVVSVCINGTKFRAAAYCLAAENRDDC